MRLGREKSVGAWKRAHSNCNWATFYRRWFSWPICSISFMRELKVFHWDYTLSKDPISQYRNIHGYWHRMLGRLSKMVGGGGRSLWTFWVLIGDVGSSWELRGVLQPSPCRVQEETKDWNKARFTNMTLSSVSCLLEETTLISFDQNH